MSTIKAKVTDQNFIFTESPQIYSGDINTDHLKFEFDEVWTGYTKTAVFYNDVANRYYAVLHDDECTIPHEVMATDGKVFIGVFGVLDDKVITSEVLFYDIGKGAIVSDEMPEPSPTIWAQILADYTLILQEIAGIRADNADFQEQIIADQEAYQQQWNEQVEDKIDETEQATLQCLDAISSLQIEMFNADGGTPFTDNTDYEFDINGGYPV